MRIIAATLYVRISVLLLLQCASRSHAAATHAAAGGFVGCADHGANVTSTGTGPRRLVLGSPALVVIGAQKAGTTVLAMVLDKLPGWCRSRVREPHFLTSANGPTRR
jgi:hypothetical protein